MSCPVRGNPALETITLPRFNLACGISQRAAPMIC